MPTQLCQKCKQAHPGRVCDYDDLAFRSQLLRLTLPSETMLAVTRPKEAFMGGHLSQEILRECYVKSKQARMFALCAQIAAEYDRDTFTQLIYELNDLLEGKPQRLDGTEMSASLGSN